MPHINTGKEPIKSLEATIENSVVDLSNIGFTAAEIKKAHRAVITSNAHSCHYTYCGTLVPSTTVGHLITTGGRPTVLHAINFNNLKFIRDTGSSATLTITLED